MGGQGWRPGLGRLRRVHLGTQGPGRRSVRGERVVDPWLRGAEPWQAPAGRGRKLARPCGFCAE